MVFWVGAMPTSLGSFRWENADPSDLDIPLTNSMWCSREPNFLGFPLCVTITPCKFYLALNDDVCVLLYSTLCETPPIITT